MNLSSVEVLERAEKMSDTLWTAWSDTSTPCHQINAANCDRAAPGTVLALPLQQTCYAQEGTR
jgi:hypothetical protein